MPNFFLSQINLFSEEKKEENLVMFRSLQHTRKLCAKGFKLQDQITRDLHCPGTNTWSLL